LAFSGADKSLPVVVSLSDDCGRVSIEESSSSGLWS